MLGITPQDGIDPLRWFLNLAEEKSSGNDKKLHGELADAIVTQLGSWTNPTASLGAFWSAVESSTTSIIHSNKVKKPFQNNDLVIVQNLHAIVSEDRHREQMKREK